MGARNVAKYGPIGPERVWPGGGSGYWWPLSSLSLADESPSPNGELRLPSSRCAVPARGPDES
ncbi:hypothetical protein [Nocardia uniformis]|uniref:hypothetical protein n=1 Tax=Nocardia uniformis TaxID=53432 RepID=UPI000A610B25|nr:hypothetical protein [Nocardia uniformis]